MKFAIYSIAKNEAASVKRFMDSIKPHGIPVYVLDTNDSTDGTYDLLREHGAHVAPVISKEEVKCLWKPFNFSDGKNAALSLVPHDVDFVINLDLDEMLTPEMTDVLKNIGPETTRVFHLYQPDIANPRVREECRIHMRHGYRWQLPIHEELVPVKGLQDTIQCIDVVAIRQYPSTERRHTWTERLLAAVAELPQNPRLRMLCGRDLYFDGRFKESITQFSAFIELSDDPFDRSYVWSMIARCNKQLKEPARELMALQESVKCGLRRESAVELSYAHMVRENYKECLKYAKKALEIKRGCYSAHNDPGAWMFKPYELAMIASYNLGKFSDAVLYGEKAVELSSGKDQVQIASNLLEAKAAV